MNSSIISDINLSSFAVALKRQKGLKKLGVQPSQTVLLECHLCLSMNLIFVFVQQAAQGITKGFLQTFGLTKICILNATSPII
jgi:hypothetical protein